MAPASKQKSKQPFVEARRLAVDTVTADAPRAEARQRNDRDVLLDEASIPGDGPNARDAVVRFPSSGVRKNAITSIGSSFIVTSKSPKIFGPPEAM